MKLSNNFHNVQTTTVIKRFYLGCSMSHGQILRGNVEGSGLGEPPLRPDHISRRSDPVNYFFNFQFNLKQLDLSEGIYAIFKHTGGIITVKDQKTFSTNL